MYTFHTTISSMSLNVSLPLSRNYINTSSFLKFLFPSVIFRANKTTEKFKDKFLNIYLPSLQNRIGLFLRKPSRSH